MRKTFAHLLKKSRYRDNSTLLLTKTLFLSYNTHLFGDLTTNLVVVGPSFGNMTSDQVQFEIAAYHYPKNTIHCICYTIHFTILNFI